MGRLGFLLSVIMISTITASLMANIYLIRVTNQLTRLTSHLRVNIDEINSNPSEWVNKTVMVEGKLYGRLGFVGVPPPWDFKLFRTNETKNAVHKLETVFIGVRWTSNDPYDFEDTIVVGVIREGHWFRQPSEERQVCYYIEAIEIVRL